MLRVWLAMEAAVGERPADALVEDQEEQGDLDTFLRQAVGVASAVALDQAMPLSLRRS